MPTPTRQCSPELLASITARAQSVACCLLVAPEEGEAVGLTTLDVDVEIDGITYHHDPGLSATELAAQITFSVDNMEIKGPCDEALIKRDDILGGVFDNADFNLFAFDFEHPEYGTLVVQTGNVGNADYVDDEYSFELRSLSQKLQRSVGEVTRPLCRNDIFDAGCGLDENGTHPTLGIPYKYTGVAVTERVSRLKFKVVIESADVPAGYFEGGLLVWETGANAQQRSEVKKHEKAGSTHTLTLQEPPRVLVSPGDTLRLRKGCKKTIPACLDVANVVNKSSEDYLPGTNEMLRRAGE